LHFVPPRVLHRSNLHDFITEVMYDEDYKLWVSGDSSVRIVTSKVSASEEEYFDI